MSEAGGPSTQSGILYQNTIAALYLGRLCVANRLPPNERVVEVRCEAPTTIDDIVLTFADDHREYIQAKGALKPKGPVWEELWQDFAHQFRDNEFQRDRDQLVLFVGEHHPIWRTLREMSKRTAGNVSFSEWNRRLNCEQKRWLERVQTILSPMSLCADEQCALFRCLRVHDENLDDLVFRTYRELPACNVLPVTLFRLLRDRVGQYASCRKAIRQHEVQQSLQSEHGIFFDHHVTSSDSDSQNQLYLFPKDHSCIRWFVSSRMRDDCLRTERDAVIEAITQIGMIEPWAYERDIPAGYYPYEETCLHFARTCDGLVLLIDGNVSPLCRKEFDTAASANKPCYIFIKADTTLDAGAAQFVAEQRRKGSNPIRFHNPNELKSLIGKALHIECVQRFRQYHHMHLAVSTDQARLR